jgi:signal-transduction protein with cAMP-binding, CBS, and nucleotidyltransferase domain
MKLNQLRELIKQVVKEEGDYQDYFKAQLAKTGKSITDMDDEEKKKFFNSVDAGFKAKDERIVKEVKKR